MSEKGGISIRAKNDAKIKRRLTNIIKSLENEESDIDRALMKAGMAVESTSVSDYLSGPRPGTLDRVTGTLAASMNTRKQGKLTVSVGTNVKYAKIHEYGGTIVQVTGNVIFIPPRPFLRTAAADRRDTITRYVQAACQKVLRGV